MICRRPPEKARGGLWEFVGGKIEPGEDPRAALERECCEELGIPVSVGDVFADVTHEYPDVTVHLTLYQTVFGGEPQRIEHLAFAWILPAQIGQYEFCPADVPLLEKIRLSYADEWETRILPGVYQHYKGNLYRVEGVCRHSETLEPLVVYRALYGEGKLWVRPAAMFTETVQVGEKRVPRFARLSD